MTQTLQAVYILIDIHMNNLFDHLTNVHILLLIINCQFSNLS